MGKRIIFTGGSGKAGQYVVQELLRYGHEILNLDLTRLDNPDVHTIKCDLTDAGQVYSALSTQFKLTEPLAPGVPSPPDAVVHFAGYPQPLLAPDNEIFRTNVMAFHNVVEAACKLGVKKIIFASSATVYGVSYAQGQRDFASFPIDEELDVNPTDPYGLSKLVCETTARSFAARFNVDIYCLRIGRIILPHEYDDYFESYVYEAHKWAVHLWSYTDVRDLGQICHRCVEKDGLGWQIFNAGNDSATHLEISESVLKAAQPGVRFTRAMDPREAPMTNRKIRELLGFREEHDWRRYFTKWRGTDGEMVRDALEKEKTS